jgi:HAD superfamily hydrolase (TIGR01458 family)
MTAERSNKPALDRVRGLLLDVDGVLHVSDHPVPGAAEALAALRRAAIPHLLLTNTTTATRATLGRRLRTMGLVVDDDRLLTAAMATAAFVQRRTPGARCYLIAKGDVADEFTAAGLQLASDDDDDPADLVIIGGAEERLTYERMNRAFRLLLGGARLVTMHRNRWWQTAAGPALDSGPFVRALEEATGVRATVVGKPSALFFRQGLRALGLPAADVAMVGDDARTDLAPARRLGMTTILVRTGKPVGATEERVADLVLDSVAGLPGALHR